MCAELPHLSELCPRYQELASTYSVVAVVVLKLFDLVVVVAAAVISWHQLGLFASFAELAFEV